MERENTAIKIPALDLIRMRDFVHEYLGLTYPDERKKDLEKGIIAACIREGFSDTESCLNWVRSNKDKAGKVKALARSLTIGETYFFRDKNLFKFLRTEFFPRIISNAQHHGNSIRIWSAGCSSGEEPYSISIVLHELIPDIENWSIEILASDINTDALIKAKKGEYSSWSFRDASPIVKERFFKRTKDGKYIIHDIIKNSVKFAEINLITDKIPDIGNGTILMDLILCRNVIMYFSNDMVNRVIQGFHRALKDEGYLIVSPQEISYLQNHNFATIMRDDVFLHKKAETNSNKSEISFINQVKFTYSQDNLHFLPEPSAKSVMSPGEQNIAIEMTTNSSDNIWAEVAKLLEIKPPKSSEKPGEDIFVKVKNLANDGKSEEALHLCNKSLENDRLNPRLHYLKATIFQENGQVQDAIRSLRQALYADKDYIPAHLNLGTLMKKEGKEKESNRHFKNALLSLRGREDSEILEDTGELTVGRIRIMLEHINTEVIK